MRLPAVMMLGLAIAAGCDSQPLRSEPARTSAAEHMAPDSDVATERQDPAKTETSAPGSGSEQLLAVPPDKFKPVYQFNNDGTRLVEFVPEEESATDWSTRIVFESHESLKDSSPIDVLMGEVTKLQDDCSFVQHFNLHSGFENDYPTSVRMIMCGHHTHLDKGKFDLIKTISGDEYLYIIRINKRVPSFDVSKPPVAPGEVAAWSTWLKRITVCDRERPGHPCPESDVDR